MKKTLLTFSLLMASFLFSQDVNPPTVNKPSANNKILVDQLIESTDFENYFMAYCKRKIEQAAKNKNWDNSKKQKIISSVDFKLYKDTIYNAFSFDSDEDLKSMVDLFKKINKDRNYSMSKLFPFDALMQYNLEGYVETVIDEKYIKQ
ncbi:MULTISPECIES: hypothetical protein [Chryseobacterium]|uniref:hypothetical protein n=1 Tax=Chryseobacterium TaxID=59732 RepID=UPI001BEBB10D|nr:MULTISPECIES: hypothetical protein [Chryseobacterium]MBT2620148.1 hypothetical protein [Chryseobacterium sp. ISL-6]